MMAYPGLLAVTWARYFTPWSGQGPRALVPGGSGILTTLVIELCRIYGDMSQSSGILRLWRTNHKFGLINPLKELMIYGDHLSMNDTRYENCGKV
jgi:hypothetical protein